MVEITATPFQSELVTVGCKLSALIGSCGQKGQVHLQILKVALTSVSHGLVGAFGVS